MAEVCVEERSLDDGGVIAYKIYARRVRLAFDPARTTETTALNLLRLQLPHLDGAMNIVHRTAR